MPRQESLEHPRVIDRQPPVIKSAADVREHLPTMRAWAARHDRNQPPQIVREYFATAVRKALSGLIGMDLE